MQMCCAFICILILICIMNRRKEEEEDQLASFDKESGSIIRLNNKTILYLREVSRFLALVCILREDNYDRPGKFIN